MSAVIANIVLFQVGWLACVLGGAGQWHLFGSLLVVVLVGIHLMRARRAGVESVLILCAVVIGATWDSWLVWSGLLRYDHGQFHSLLAPHWIIAMWALFATTLNVSLRWLKGRWFLAFLFGVFGGPFAYFAGQSLGAVEVVSQVAGFAALALGWGVIMPVLMWLSQRWDGFEPLEVR